MHLREADVEGEEEEAKGAGECEDMKTNKPSWSCIDTGKIQSVRRRGHRTNSKSLIAKRFWYWPSGIHTLDDHVRYRDSS